MVVYGLWLAGCGGLYSGAICKFPKFYYGNHSEWVFESINIHTSPFPPNSNIYLQYPHHIHNCNTKFRLGRSFRLISPFTCECASVGLVAGSS
jgi:hypothetical protein